MRLVLLGAIIAALYGGIQFAGIRDRLQPLAMPTVTPTAAPTATMAPTMTPTGTTAPAPPTATPMSMPQPVIVEGGRAVVTGTGEDELRMRQDPGLQAATLLTLPDTTVVSVLEGPIPQDGFRWWRVRTEEGQEGWVVDDWLQALAP